jgi:hypothetical protein
MARITLTNDRTGLEGFPSDFTPIGHDDLGDVLAVDGKGKVFCFMHGNGDWSERLPAFASMEQIERYVAFQDQLEVEEDAGIDELKQRKLEIEAFGKEMRGSSYAREEVKAVLDDVKERIADLRFASSKRGRSIAHRQAVGQRCEAALLEAGAPGQWMVRPHVDKDRAICVLGVFAAPWDETRVVALLQPIAGELEVLCRAMR